MHPDISQIFALLKRDPRSNGSSKVGTASKVIMRQFVQSLATKYHRSRRQTITKVDQDLCVFGHLRTHPFSSEDQDLVVHQVWVATCQGQRTIAKRLTKTVITRSPPYMIYCVFNLRQTDWLGKHGPDFHLFLSQWSSYLFHNVLNS